MLVIWLVLFFCKQIRFERYFSNSDNTGNSGVGMIGIIARRWQVLTIVVSAAACTGGNEPPRVPLAQAPVTDTTAQLGDAQAGEAQPALGPAAQSALDSGNALFRKKQYMPALARYRAASALAPDHGAPLFGAYMVAQATKDTKLADSVLAEIRKRSGPASPLTAAR